LAALPGQLVLHTSSRCAPVNAGPGSAGAGRL